jgi:hypothetical protein
MESKNEEKLVDLADKLIEDYKELNKRADKVNQYTLNLIKGGNDKNKNQSKTPEKGDNKNEPTTPPKTPDVRIIDVQGLDTVLKNRTKNVETINIDDDDNAPDDNVVPITKNVNINFNDVKNEKQKTDKNLGTVVDLKSHNKPKGSDSKNEQKTKFILKDNLDLSIGMVLFVLFIILLLIRNSFSLTIKECESINTDKLDNIDNINKQLQILESKNKTDIMKNYNDLLFKKNSVLMGNFPDDKKKFIIDDLSTLNNNKYNEIIIQINETEKVFEAFKSKELNNAVLEKELINIKNLGITCP